MRPHQRELVELLVEFEVIRFGSFTLKSGRSSPYFVNMGHVRTGRAIERLGRAFAAEIEARNVDCDLVFGPSYKGVPLAVGTATALAKTGSDIGYAFDRKEAKDHGEGGVFVGQLPTSANKVVVVDDVITSGRSIREAATLLGGIDVRPTAVVVAVDRQERGRGAQTTLVELQDELRIPVYPIVTITQIVEILHGREFGGTVLVDDAERDAIAAHLREYGATS